MAEQLGEQSTTATVRMTGPPRLEDSDENIANWPLRWTGWQFTVERGEGGQDQLILGFEPPIDGGLAYTCTKGNLFNGEPADANLGQNFESRIDDRLISPHITWTPRPT